MHYSAQYDIEAPIERVFCEITRFDHYERAAMRRGADVVRKDRLQDPGLGARWDTCFMLRGKARDLSIEVVTFEPHSDLVLVLNSSNVTGAVRFELFALSKTRTRLTVVTDVRPLTLAARVFLKSLNLSKSALNKRYGAKISEFGEEVEARAQTRP